jgi:putative inorganic carbon (HCO3(-)) transporter
MMQSTQHSNKGIHEVMPLRHKGSIAIVALICFAVVILTLLSVWAAYELGAPFGAMTSVALSGLIIIAALTLVGDYDLLVPALCLCLLFPLNKGLGPSGPVVYSFDFVLISLYAVWIYRAATGRSARIRISHGEILALALIYWLFVSAVGGTNPSNSLNGALYFLRLYLVYLYVANNINSSRALKWLLVSLLFLLAVQSSVALVQYVTKTNVGSLSDMVGETIGSIREVEVVAGYLFRARGTLTTDTALAQWFDLLLPFTFSLLLARTINWTTRTFLLLLLGMGLVALILTFTRGAWVGTLAGMMAVIGLWLRNRWYRVTNLLLVLILAAVAGSVILPLSGLVLTRWSGTEDDSLIVRKNLDTAALEMIRQYPVFGVGWDNFAERAPDFGVGLSWQREGAIHKAHNLYLAIASEAGLLGLLIFMGLLVAVFRIGWSTLHANDPWSETLTIGILGSFVAVLVHGLVAWGLVTYSVFPLFWLLMGLLVALNRLSRASIGGTLDRTQDTLAPGLPRS